MSARKPFDWSKLDRNNLYCLLYSVRDQVVNKKLSSDRLQKILGSHIKKHIPIRVKGCKDLVTDSGYVYIGGAYYSEADRKGRSRPIEINFTYNMLDEFIKLSDYKFKRMCILFADTMLHEIIHMRQFRARSFKAVPIYASTAERARDRKEQEYYGDTDEMGAFSFNIACEMIDRFGNDPRSIRLYMDSTECRRHRRSQYYRYLKAFKWDTDHKIIKRLKKKVLLQLPNAELGKPFKTVDHLTY